MRLALLVAAIVERGCAGSQLRWRTLLASWQLLNRQQSMPAGDSTAEWRITRASSIVFASPGMPLLFL